MNNSLCNYIEREPLFHIFWSLHFQYDSVAISKTNQYQLFTLQEKVGNAFSYVSRLLLKSLYAKEELHMLK